MSNKTYPLINNLSKEKIDFCADLPIFAELNPEQLKIITTHLTVSELDPGEILFRESDRGSFVCFIAEGALDVIMKSDATGKNVVLSTLVSGQSIGEMSIIENMPRSATVKAQKKTTLIILSKSAFDLILERHSTIATILLKGISRLLSKHLRETSKKLADYMPPLT